MLHCSQASPCYQARGENEARDALTYLSRPQQTSESDGAQHKGAVSSLSVVMGREGGPSVQRSIGHHWYWVAQILVEFEPGLG